MTLGPCCFTGAIHAGDPKGSFETIGGIETYVALPTGEHDKTVAILLLTDVCGSTFVNNKLLADSFAANGFATYVPDLFDGEPFPDDRLGDRTWGTAWKGRHTPSVADVFIGKVMSSLKESGVKSVGATGYCFGGKGVVELAIKNAIKVGVVAHPAFIKVPEDLLRLKESSRCPILWNVPELDGSYTTAKADQASEIFAESELYKRVDYPGCKHGFASRGDLDDPEVKAAKDKCFDETVRFFQKYL
ncbi:hypothetical protein RQP46_005717 [Phenoliferia psychrophenolica]